MAHYKCLACKTRLYSAAPPVGALCPVVDLLIEPEPTLGFEPCLALERSEAGGYRSLSYRREVRSRIFMAMSPVRGMRGG
jgi:hypothetical protein